MAPATTFMKQVVAAMVKDNHFDKVYSGLKVISAGKGSCKCEMVVEPQHTNRFDTLHGGFTATLVDAVSTFALLTTEQALPGVSVDMNISYLRPAKVGETIVIDAQTVKTGKKLAFLTVDLLTKDGSKLVAQGKHTKFFPGE